IVAVNTIDKPSAEAERLSSELSQDNLISEAWGGGRPVAEVTAHTGPGSEGLRDAVLLQPDLRGLQAIVDCPAQGVVIESSLDEGRGPVATVLVQNGTLKLGDIVLVGHEYGRIRAMLDENGQQTKSAGPSIPVEILGLNGTPEAGDDLIVVESEKKAREVAEFRLHRHREALIAKQQAAKAESLFATMGKDNK